VTAKAATRLSSHNRTTAEDAAIALTQAPDMDLTDYRNAPRERDRVADLMALVPGGTRRALDIGARDGYLSRALLRLVPAVTALDLEQPTIDVPGITCVRGNAAALDFEDGAFDLVFCAEVLEHIPPQLLERVCRELVRVSAGHLIIGVPHRQDLRMHCTTCQSCGRTNPPWGHVNSFTVNRLAELFKPCHVERVSFSGQTKDTTNALSAALMRFAGHPFGTYDQEEPCIHCGQSIGQPAARSLPQRVATRLAVQLQSAQMALSSTRGNWLHVLLAK